MADTSLSGKSVAYALLAIVGTVVVYMFAFRNGVEMVRQGSQERANNQATIQALQKKLTDLRALQTQFSTNLPQVNALAVAMPADPQYAEIVAMLETMAARAGLVLETIQPSAASGNGLPVSVNVRGGYGNVLTFVELMEKNVRPMQVGTLSLAGGEDDVAMTITVSAVYQVPVAEVVEAPAEGVQ